MVGRWDSWTTIVPKAPMVVSETVDGDALIMHHGTGCYFNALGTGALLWEHIERGATLQALGARLAEACGVSPGDALASAGRFLDTLAEYDLIKPGAGMCASLPPAAPLAFAEPELSVHVDLADMLLLDPVHDVDEAGWPAPRASDQSGASWSV